MHARADALIAELGQRPHPEGGYYREVFRSEAKVVPSDGRGPHAALTTIYFLLPGSTVSRWHRVASDEVWHFYEGDSLELLELSAPGGDLVRRELGPLRRGLPAPIRTSPAGHWQAARPLGAFTLVGCTVAPGFDFADFRLLADDPEHGGQVRSRWSHVAALI